MLGPCERRRTKPVEVEVAMVLNEPYSCGKPDALQVIAMPGEYVVNPGSEDEYPITRERLAELYEEVAP